MEDPERHLHNSMRTFMVKAANGAVPRLGTLSLKGRAPLNTPNYIGNSSRGVVPHLSHDVMKTHSRIPGLYVALEDFIEKTTPKTPPIYEFAKHKDVSPLRHFIGLPEPAIVVLGARRSPPVVSPVSHTNSSISILTSVGFRSLTSDEYAAAATKLRPDIVVGLGDLVFGRKPGLKRTEKMCDRTLKWLQRLFHELQGLSDNEESNPMIFAPIHPVPNELQSLYLSELADNFLHNLSGLAVYHSGSITDLPEPLDALPRLSLAESASPHGLLSDIARGIDIFTVPFVGAATDAGVALCFTFPPTNGDTAPDSHQSLGIDMWLSSHAIDISPLQTGCTCYVCMRHHRAYLQHLLTAKEMLGWVLLQIHNYHVLDEFFAGVRTSIARGTYEEDRVAFQKLYEGELPQMTGQGPRVRGYQFKSEGAGERKRNSQPYRMLDANKELLAESSLPSSNADAEFLEDKGFAESLAE